MPTLKYTVPLLIALCAYPLYQTGIVQAETIDHSLSLHVSQTDNSSMKKRGHTLFASITPLQNKEASTATHAQHQQANINNLLASTKKLIRPAMKVRSKQKQPYEDTKKLKNQLQCLALNIYFEARGEPEQGKRAVGHVVMNRLKNRRFPDSVCAVVKQGGDKRLHRCQFSWWCDGRSDMPADNKAWIDSQRIASEILRGESKDPTGGALWYHANYVNPYWQSSFQKGPQIGQHIFYLATR